MVSVRHILKADHVSFKLRDELGGKAHTLGPGKLAWKAQFWHAAIDVLVRQVLGLRNKPIVQAHAAAWISPATAFFAQLPGVVANAVTLRLLAADYKGNSHISDGCLLAAGQVCFKKTG
jgi:hypothetical protein